eukprot:2578023-Rhodomonas_salina.2
MAHELLLEQTMMVTLWFVASTMSATSFCTVVLIELASETLTIGEGEWDKGAGMCCTGTKGQDSRQSGRGEERDQNGATEFVPAYA